MMFKLKENTSEMTSAKIRKIQMDSTSFEGLKYSKHIVAIIFTLVSKICEIALLYGFSTEEKYPPITEDTEISGNPREISKSGISETIFFNQVAEMIGANRITRTEERTPSNTAKMIEVFTAFIPLI